MSKIAALLFCLLPIYSFGGNYPFYYNFTQHTQNQLLYNPAYAGSTDKLNLHARSMHVLYKYTGTRGSVNPLNFGYVSFDRPCPTIRGAWGAYMVFDVPNVAGRYYTLSTGGTYAYRLQINEDHRLQLGIGINYRRLFANQLYLIDPNLPTGPGNNIATRTASNHLDFSSGIWYRHKGLNAGVSLTHFGNFAFARISNAWLKHYSPVFSTYISYKIDVTDNFQAEPYLYISTAQGNYDSNANWGDKAQVALGVMGGFKEAFYIGFAYQHQQVVSPSLGFQLKKKLRIQGTYNLLLGQEGNNLRYHNFELGLSVQLPHKEKPRK